MATRDELTQVLTAIETDNWDPNRNPIDYHLLDGVRSPGLFTFQNLKSSLKWDVLQGPGLSGGFPIYRGLKLAEFSAVMRLYDASDWAQFALYRKLLKRPAVGTRPKALRILHPILDLIDPPIRSVVVTDWEPPAEPDDTGVFTFRVDFLEFRKPTPSYAKPDAAKPQAAKDPVDAKIEELTAVVQELAR